MRLIASAAPLTRLPALGYLHQPDGFACPSAGHPCAARGRAAGPDLRRMIQLPVVSRLPLVQLAPKADRTGPVEGQICRLKTIKRTMCGRAGFDLLRHRVLEAA